MAATFETVSVGVIVGAALLWAGRALWRAGRKKQVCTTCGQAGTCPLVTKDGATPEPATGDACGAVPEFARPPE